MNSQFRDLSDLEVAHVDGGLLPLVPLIPIAIAFGKGFGIGVAIGGGVLLVADALDIE
ncbi:hypothetical protein [Lysobacter sp. A3-1-A15]|uniref:hypothetical protein n=1 Tax=Novilysobacter viscosus TaxID=3098602 RepID=UPI002EDB27B6